MSRESRQLSNVWPQQHTRAPRGPRWRRQKTSLVGGMAQRTLGGKGAVFTDMKRPIHDSYRSLLKGL